MKTRLAVFAFMILAIFPLNVLPQSNAGPLTFFASTNKADIGTPTIITLCGVQTGSGSGHTIGVSQGNYFIFRFGAGFGTLTDFSAARVQSRNGGLPIGSTSISDFDVETQYAAGKILFEYEQAEAHQLGYLDEICVDAHWTPPASPSEGTIDLNVTLDPQHPTTAVLKIFVR